MKRYEQFNKIYNENETIEEQSLTMIVAHISEVYDVDIKDINPIKRRYRAQLEWLDEEVE